MQVFKDKAAPILHKLVFVLLAALLFPLAAHAEDDGPVGPAVTTSGPASGESAQSFSLPYNGTKSFTVGSYKVKVDNGQSSNLSILSGGKTVYQNKAALSRVENVYRWDVSGQSYLVVTYRLAGSGGYVSFDVLKLDDNGNVTELYQSESYEHGGVKVVNGSLSVSFPVYEKGDSEVEPSALKKKVYQIANGNLALVDQQKQSLDYGYVHTLSGGSTDITENTQCKDVTDKPEIDCGTNPSIRKIASLLTKYAVKYNIPPEIVKAIAWQESHWKQYWNATVPDDNPCQKHVEGHVVVSYDCTYRPEQPGLGIMQYTSYSTADTTEATQFRQRLKSSIEFNIEQGIQLFKEKWDLTYPKTTAYYAIPKVNNGSPDVLENWYFAILAYNGVSKKNDPTQNSSTYQEGIYNIIENHTFLDITEFPADKLNTYYQKDKHGDRILFKQHQINTPGPYHLTKHGFEPGDIVITSGQVHLRPAADTSSDNAPELASNVKLKVISDEKGRSVPIPDADKDNHYVWYPVKVLNGKYQGRQGYIGSTWLSQTVELNNNDVHNRYGTSVRISQYGWPANYNGGEHVVVLARGDLPPDSLAGTVLAKKYNAPILLTQTDELPKVVNNELDRLKPTTVYILGGPGAVSDKVENKLKAKGYTNDVIRLRGEYHNRYGTAIQVAEEVDGPDTHTLIIASGDEKSPDALSASPYAGAKQIPILLTAQKGLPDSVKQYVKGISDQINKVFIIGGPGPISKNVEQQLMNLGIGKGEIERVHGDDRYSTSVAVAKRFDYSHGRVLFARGAPGRYIDALSGAPLAALYNAPIILTLKDEIPTNAKQNSVKTWLNARAGLPRLYYLGGYGAINESVRNNIQQTLLDN